MKKIFKVELINCLAWDLLKDQVKKALTVKVLNYLDDVGMVKVLEDLDLLEGSQEGELLGDCLDLADAFDLAVALEHLADDAVAATEYP